MPVDVGDDDGADDKKERITIRVTEKEFEEIDKKRRSFGIKTKLQPFGHRLLLAWARGKLEDATGVSRGEEGEFVKCPTRIRPVILTAIARLIEMDPEDLPTMERLIVRFSQPGYIQTVLDENAREALKTGPQPVPPKTRNSG